MHTITRTEQDFDLVLTHHSREPRTHAVPCVRCRKDTFEFDRRCALCAIAAETPATEDTYFVFDLDVDHVDIPDHRPNPDEVMADLLNALETA